MKITAGDSILDAPKLFVSRDVVKAMCLLILCFLTVSCAFLMSWDDKSELMVGQPSSIYVDRNGPPDEVKELPDGTRELKYYLKGVDPSCIHYWIVDSHDTIVDYRYSGNCRPIG